MGLKCILLALYPRPICCCCLNTNLFSSFKSVLGQDTLKWLTNNWCISYYHQYLTIRDMERILAMTVCGRTRARTHGPSFRVDISQITIHEIRLNADSRTYQKVSLKLLQIKLVYTLLENAWNWVYLLQLFFFIIIFCQCLIRLNTSVVLL